MAFEECVTLPRGLLPFHLLRPVCVVMVAMDSKPLLSQDMALTLPMISPTLSHPFCDTVPGFLALGLHHKAGETSSIPDT